jgi:hypothetical protein
MGPERSKSDRLREWDEHRLVARIERADRTSVHGVIPGHFFSAASSECRDAFIDGHFYACISLCQAVAEALSRYLGDAHKLGAKKDPAQRVRRLRGADAISQSVSDAFACIRGNDRNAFHHVNPDIPTGYEELETRAEECVNSLLTIESDVFAFHIVEGRVAPGKPEYWPAPDSQHMMDVFVRLQGH